MKEEAVIYLQWIVQFGWETLWGPHCLFFYTHTADIDFLIESHTATAALAAAVATSAAIRNSRSSEGSLDRWKLKEDRGGGVIPSGTGPKYEITSS